MGLGGGFQPSDRWYCYLILGICVSLVLKYADSILKSFATSLSIILSSMVSMMWFDFQADLTFYVGAGIVLSSVYIYQSY